ncbi:MAG: hypothetical protein HFJ55_04780 [Clostridia bacterium]|nr:hypothetical protein [Clostridia bacterium]
MKIIENFENSNSMDIESLKKFDEEKTKVLKYVTYKKRTEQEIRNKFRNQIEENMLEDVIEYLKEAGYINDYEFVERQVNEYMNLKTMSIKEIKYKLYTKGVDKKLIEKYIDKNIDALQEYEGNCMQKIRDKKAQTMDEREIEQYLYKKGYKCD